LNGLIKDLAMLAYSQGYRLRSFGTPFATPEINKIYNADECE
jgi:hypothetical protein